MTLKRVANLERLGDDDDLLRHMCAGQTLDTEDHFDQSPSILMITGANIMG